MSDFLNHLGHKEIDYMMFMNMGRSPARLISAHLQET